MRGLPSCGKSWTAKHLAAQEGGEVFEFDSFFVRSAPDSDATPTFRWDRKLLPDARKRQFERVSLAIGEGISPIVVDDDHRPGPTAKAIVVHALANGYCIEFAEPSSPWWKTIRCLLENKSENTTALGEWAQKLCRMSATNHRVSLRAFVARMDRWKNDMTLHDILAWGENDSTSTDKNERTAA